MAETRTELAEDEWLSTVTKRSAVEDIHPIDDLVASRRLLVDWYLIAEAAPPELLRHYATFEEADLTRRAAFDLESMHRGDFSLRLAGTSDAVAALLGVGARLRALDDLLAIQAHDHGLPSDPEGTWLVKGSADDAFLIPRYLPRKPPRARQGKPVTAGPFTHRSLIHHRVLPTRIGSRAVRLACAAVRLGRDDGPLILGGGLFPGLHLIPEPVGKCFRIKAVQCDRQEEVADEIMRQALVDDCCAVVFPELTISPDLRNRIERSLRRQPPRPGRQRSIPLVIAGSWHEPAGARYRNVAPILDGFGAVVARHEKTMPYDYNGSMEALQRGGAITVVVTEDALVGVAICLDFCDRGGTRHNPYAMLDVDLMLVPSFGNARTLDGHMATAQDMKTRWRTETFVVQQGDRLPPPGIGYVLAPADDLKSQATDLVSDQPWNRRPASGTLDRAPSL